MSCSVIMARRAIPIIAFHGVESFVSLARLCVVYVVKEVASFSGRGGGGVGGLG